MEALALNDPSALVFLRDVHRMDIHECNEYRFFDEPPKPRWRRHLLTCTDALHWFVKERGAEYVPLPLFDLIATTLFRFEQIDAPAFEQYFASIGYTFTDKQRVDIAIYCAQCVIVPMPKWPLLYYAKRIPELCLRLKRINLWPPRLFIDATSAIPRE
jgi:hypothetical protein